MIQIKNCSIFSVSTINCWIGYDSFNEILKLSSCGYTQISKLSAQQVLLKRMAACNLQPDQLAIQTSSCRDVFRTLPEPQRVSNIVRFCDRTGTYYQRPAAEGISRRDFPSRYTDGLNRDSCSSITCWANTAQFYDRNKLRRDSNSNPADSYCGNNSTDNYELCRGHCACGACKAFSEYSPVTILFEIKKGGNDTRCACLTFRLPQHGVDKRLIAPIGCKQILCSASGVALDTLKERLKRDIGRRQRAAAVDDCRNKPSAPAQVAY